MGGKRQEKGQEKSRKPEGFQDILTALIRSAPREYIAIAGKFLGMLAYMTDVRHRRIVRRNLHFTYPELARESIQGLSKRIFQNIGVTFLEICQLTCLSREDILRKVRIRGKENLLNAMNSHRGVIMISAHLGNWEMAPLFASCYLQKPFVLIARRLESRTLHRWVHRLRSRFGNTIIDKKRALPKMARTLRKGQALGLLIDQETRPSEGVEVTFFGRTANATFSAALLARRYDSSVLPAFCVREADGGLVFVVEPPIILKKTKDLSGDLRANTQIMTSVIEKAIRAYPEQWFWFHKRWKQHHPYLYPEDLARRQRRRDKEKAATEKGAKRLPHP